MPLLHVKSPSSNKEVHLSRHVEYVLLYQWFIWSFSYYGSSTDMSSKILNRHINFGFLIISKDIIALNYSFNSLLHFICFLKRRHIKVDQEVMSFVVTLCSGYHCYVYIWDFWYTSHSRVFACFNDAVVTVPLNQVKFQALWYFLDSLCEA